jgi:hypothetical protein
MTTSYSVTFSFSNSYSMLTSHVPSFEGEGQQFTTECSNENGERSMAF